MRTWIYSILIALTAALPARAHEGPPFPIIVDQIAGPYVVSVWSDPDIGTGTFFVVLEPGDGTLAVVRNVRIGVRPISGRLDEVIYEAEPQSVRYGARYYTEVEFDQGEMWSVRIIIEGEDGGGELLAEVEATPDGTIGPIGLILYLLPFLAVGYLWIKAALRKKQLDAAPRTAN